MNYIAIIGDIIDSRNLRDRNQVQKKLMDQLGKINRLYSDDIKADFKITLGDEFQGLMYSESKAPIEVICKLAQMLYPVKIRFGIGVGDISTKIIENQPAMMDGPCFHMARKAITKVFTMKQEACPHFLWPEDFRARRSNIMQLLEKPEKKHSFGCLNEFVETMVSILEQELQFAIEDIDSKLDEISALVLPDDATKSQQKIYKLLAESTIFSGYGVNNTEIQEHTGLSKRSVVNGITAFREKGLLADTQVGHFVFHRLK